MRRIAVINQKGGVGKTTTTVNLGAALARAGHRVLLVDLDPQAHLTLHLGMDPADRRPGVYDLLTGSASLALARTRLGSNLWVVGASIDLAAAEVELVGIVGREVILRDQLLQHTGESNGHAAATYDYVIMDCPPSLGVLTLNGLCAAQEVILPLQPHYLALQGLSKLLETVSLVDKRINPGLTVTGVVICMKEAGTRLGAEVVEDVRAFLESARETPVPWRNARVFETSIRRNIKLAEAPSYGQSIFDYALDSNGARDYEALAAEIQDPAAFAARADQAPVSADASPQNEPENERSPSQGETPSDPPPADAESNSDQPPPPPADPAGPPTPVSTAIIHMPDSVVPPPTHTVGAG